MDGINFSLPGVTFELFFAVDGGVGIGDFFKVDDFAEAVFGGEAVCECAAAFQHAAIQVVDDANV